MTYNVLVGTLNPTLSLTHFERLGKNQLILITFGTQHRKDYTD